MKFVLFIMLIIVLASCASHEHVRPGADGIHHVLVRGTTKDMVEQSAIGEATTYCKEFKQNVAFISDKTTYTGSMDESTHNAIRKGSEAAMIGGSILGTMGGTRDSHKVGAGVAGAGAVGSVFQDENAYTSDMTFKCI